MKNILFVATFSILATFAFGEGKILGKSKKEFTILGKGNDKKRASLGNSNGKKPTITIKKGNSKKPTTIFVDNGTILGKGKNEFTILGKDKNEFSNLGENITAEEYELDLITAELELITAEEDRKELAVAEDKMKVAAKVKKKEKRRRNCPVTPEQQFAEIRKAFMYFTENQQYFEKKRSRPNKLRKKMEHGEALDYFNRDEQLIKRTETYLSKESKFVIEYILQDGELRFILTASSGKAAGKKIVTNRHFFYCDKMIKWLDKKRKPVKIGTKEYLAKEKELLDNYPFKK